MSRTRKPPVAKIPLQLLDVDAKNGAMVFLADDVLLAIGQWVDGQFVYPSGATVEFTPKYYRALGQLILPLEGNDG